MTLNKTLKINENQLPLNPPHSLLRISPPSLGFILSIYSSGGQAYALFRSEAKSKETRRTRRLREKIMAVEKMKKCKKV